MQEHVQDHYVQGLEVYTAAPVLPKGACRHTAVVGLDDEDRQLASACAVQSASRQPTTCSSLTQQGPSKAATSVFCGAAPAISREGSCSLPQTPQPEKPLPAIRIRRYDSDVSAASPVGAPAQEDQSQHCPQPCLGWFFNCRGCGCMTAYEQQFAGMQVPFCRRCQVLLAEAKPALQDKMVHTLLYVHRAWSDAGL